MRTLCLALALCGAAAVPAERYEVLKQLESLSNDIDAAAASRGAMHVRGPDGRLEPLLTLPGDTLDDTAPMVVITAAGTLVAAGVVARAFAMAVFSSCSARTDYSCSSRWTLNWSKV